MVHCFYRLHLSLLWNISSIPCAAECILRACSFHMWSPVPLSLLPLSCPSVLPSPRWLPLVCFLYLCLFLFRYIHLFYFLIPQVSSNRVFVFFCVFFISHTTNPPGPSMLLQMARFHSFYGWVVFHCTFTPIFFIYSFLDGHFKVEVNVTQSCPTLYNPMNYTVHGFSRPEYWSG